MTLNRDDFAILDKFEFDIQPVAVNYLVKPPENITRIDQKMTLCEMLVKAQKGDPFYSDPEDHACGAGTYVLGQSDIEDQFIDGEYGAGRGSSATGAQPAGYITIFRKLRVMWSTMSLFHRWTSFLSTLMFSFFSPMAARRKSSSGP